MSRKHRRRARHNDKLNSGIAPGDLNGQVPSIEDGVVKVTPAAPFAPFAKKPEDPIADFDVQRLLDLRYRRGDGTFRNIGMDETVDIAAITKANGGRPPKFLAMKKATVDAFNAKMDAATKERMPRPADSTERLMAALKSNGVDVLSTADPLSTQRAINAEFINDKLASLSVENRYLFLQHELIDILGPNDGTDAWSERLGCLMAFVHNTLPEEMAHRMADEVLEKLRPSSRDDHRLMDKVARQAADKIEKTLETLPPDMAAKIVTELFNGKMMVEDGPTTDKIMPGFTDHVTRHLAKSGSGRETIMRLLDSKNCRIRWTPEQRAKLQIYLDTGDTGPVREALREKHRDLEATRSVLDREEARLAARERHDQAMNDLIAMAKAPRLTRLGETGYHKAIQAWDDGSLIVPQMEPLGGLSEVLSRGATVFVVQHDWASAFEKATDFSEGEVQLPYNDIVFEFRIAGRRVCCCIRGEESQPVACLLLVETSVGWTLAGLYQIRGGLWAYYQDGEDIVASVLNVCREQIRAVSIALEAELVETEVVRAPHRLNRKRERAGKIPMFDHHVVHLANRKRILPREPLPGDIEDEHHGKRLHFVRGHWMHLSNHKTWRRWHLRGNPDIGFVDKEYRL